LYPFSYLALLYQNFIDIWEKGGNKKDCWIETTQFISMIFKGPFVLLAVIFFDTYKFIISLYTKNIKMNNERAYNTQGDVSKLDSESLKTLKETLFSSHNKLVDTKHLIKMLSSHFNIHAHIHSLIYSTPSPSHLSSIKQFNLLKNFLFTNSIPLETAPNSLVPNPTDSSSEEEYDARDYLFEINARKLVRGKQPKRQVVDTAKVLRLLEELEERQEFEVLVRSKVAMDRE